jgi:hypothetical protein
MTSSSGTLKPIPKQGPCFLIVLERGGTLPPDTSRLPARVKDPCEALLCLWNRHLTSSLFLVRPLRTRILSSSSLARQCSTPPPVPIPGRRSAPSVHMQDHIRCTDRLAARCLQYQPFPPKVPPGSCRFPHPTGSNQPSDIRVIRTTVHGSVRNEHYRTNHHSPTDHNVHSAPPMRTATWTSMYRPPAHERWWYF